MGRRGRKRGAWDMAYSISIKYKLTYRSIPCLHHPSSLSTLLRAFRFPPSFLPSFPAPPLVVFFMAATDDRAHSPRQRPLALKIPESRTLKTGPLKKTTCGEYYSTGQAEKKLDDDGAGIIIIGQSQVLSGNLVEATVPSKAHW